MGPRATVMVVLACALAALAGFGHGIAIAAVKLPPVTISQYEHSTTPATLDAQGCNAGKGRKTGLVILDFGRPAFKSGAYGTLDFAGNFQWNVPINKAVEAYMIGYMRCRPAGLKGMLSVARGTNNSCSNEDLRCCPNKCGLEPPSFTKAGYWWAWRTNQVEKWVISKGWKFKVRATAAIDAEPAWDPPFSVQPTGLWRRLTAPLATRDGSCHRCCGTSGRWSPATGLPTRNGSWPQAATA